MSTDGSPMPQPGVQHCRVLTLTGTGVAEVKLALIYPWERKRKRATAENLVQRIADVARGQRQGSRQCPLAVPWMKAFPGLSSTAVLCREAAGEG